MYIKFCRHYGEEKIDKAKVDLSPKSMLSVDLQAEKAGKQTEGNAHLYRVACAFLAVTCLILLMVVIVLGVKLQTESCQVVEPSPKKDVKVVDNQSPPPTSDCSREHCQNLYPHVQSQCFRWARCPEGWFKYDYGCYFLSTFRLSWDEGQRNCSSQGGSLVTIKSQGLQRLLTSEGKLSYWIGLRKKMDTWSWVDNSTLTVGYWRPGKPNPMNECGMLYARSPAETNWSPSSCKLYNYFICQLQL